MNSQKSQLATYASEVAHGIDVARVYAGVLLVSGDRQIMLQLRDDKPGIANPGRITTFGGAAEKDEFEYEAACRELREELDLEIVSTDLKHLCDIKKTELDGSRTRCSIWLLEGVKIDALRLQEGKDIARGTLESLQSDERLTDTCKSILMHYRNFLCYTEAQSFAASIKLLADTTSAAHPTNEDLFNHTSNMFWLLDGASPIDKTPRMHPVSDARWLVEAVDANLESLAATDLPITQILRCAIENVRNDLLGAPSRPSYSPSAAVVIGRVRGNILEYAALADVVMAVQSDNSIWILDDQVSEIRERYIVDLEKTRGPEAVRASMWHRRQVEMNSRGGYWVLADEPEASRHVRHGYISVPSGSRILLASDGFTRLVSLYGRYTWSDLITAGPETSGEMLKELRRIESNDRERLAHPRVSTQDDATAAWIEVL